VESRAAGPSVLRVRTAGLCWLSEILVDFGNQRLFSVDRHPPALAPGRTSRLDSYAGTSSVACSVPPVSVGGAPRPRRSHTKPTRCSHLRVGPWAATSGRVLLGTDGTMWPMDLSDESRAFGDLLRRHRVLGGMSQEELAERASLSARAISDLERGVKRTPRRDTVRLLVEALRLSGRPGRPSSVPRASPPPIRAPNRCPGPEPPRPKLS
jgi:DNA-binding XRE family transcriptional regulator